MSLTNILLLFVLLGGGSVWRREAVSPSFTITMRTPEGGLDMKVEDKAKEVLETAEDKAKKLAAATAEKAKEIKAAVVEKATDVKHVVEKKVE